MNEEEAARAVRRGMIDYHNRVAAQQAAERDREAKGCMGCIFIILAFGVILMWVSVKGH
ncbi:hypothetical protein ACQKM2_33090 [Streptomyces sp. NPDC004126]|uniref:hypothetical protein n=1 Tax=Streptomyces sp. NPDC004126 TaxID=3390695 RepID=UPI003D01406D